MSWFDDTPERRRLFAIEWRRLASEENAARWPKGRKVKTEYRRRTRRRSR